MVQCRMPDTSLHLKGWLDSAHLTPSMRSLTDLDPTTSVESAIDVMRILVAAGSICSISCG